MKPRLENHEVRLARTARAVECTTAIRRAIEFSPLRMRSMRGGAGGGATRGMRRTQPYLP